MAIDKDWISKRLEALKSAPKSRKAPDAKTRKQFEAFCLGTLKTNPRYSALLNAAMHNERVEEYTEALEAHCRGVYSTAAGWAKLMEQIIDESVDGSDNAAPRALRAAYAAMEASVAGAATAKAAAKAKRASRKPKGDDAA